MCEAVFIISVLMIFLLMAALYRNLKKPKTAAVFSLISGTAGLFAANLLGAPVAVNFYTLAMSSLMGIPGVITMLVLKMLFK